MLVYHNTVAARSPARFFSEVKEAGADGVLIADLPPETAVAAVEAAKAVGVAPIFMVSPLTSVERLRRISTLAEGFLYVVSRLGTTGSDTNFDDQLRATLARARAVAKLPLCVGFGVSTPEAARQMIALGADGVVTGSRIIEIIREAGHDVSTAVGTFCAAMRQAVDDAAQAV